MTSHHKYQIRTDNDGNIVLPPEIAREYGINQELIFSLKIQMMELFSTDPSPISQRFTSNRPASAISPVGLVSGTYGMNRWARWQIPHLSAS